MTHSNHVTEGGVTEEGGSASMRMCACKRSRRAVSHARSPAGAHARVLACANTYSNTHAQCARTRTQAHTSTQKHTSNAPKHTHTQAHARTRTNMQANIAEKSGALEKLKVRGHSVVSLPQSPCAPSCSLVKGVLNLAGIRRQLFVTTLLCIAVSTSSSTLCECIGQLNEQAKIFSKSRFQNWFLVRSRNPFPFTK